MICGRTAHKKRKAIKKYNLFCGEATKGSYILLIKLARGKDILIGKLGYIHFPKAFYAYVGSAMNGFKARLAHHLKDSKKPHWHIDYLLKEADLVDIILCPSEPFASCHSERSEESHGTQGRLRMECFLAQALAREFQSIPNFGSSDCKCKSHLYFTNDKGKLRAKVAKAMDKSGLPYKISPVGGKKNGIGI